MSVCVGLRDPAGTIDQFGKSAAGSLSEVDLIAAVSVPSQDEHHITDVSLSVAEGATLTIFRLYHRTSSSGSWIQLDQWEVSQFGVLGVTLGTSHKVKSGEDWKVTGQQSTAGQMSCRVGGQALRADSRTAA